MRIVIVKCAIVELEVIESLIAEVLGMRHAPIVVFMLRWLLPYCNGRFLALWVAFLLQSSFRVLGIASVLL
jgi:hypothetical protein